MKNINIYSLWIDGDESGVLALGHEKLMLNEFGLVWDSSNGLEFNIKVVAGLVAHSRQFPNILFNVGIEHGLEVGEHEFLVLYIKNGCLCSFKCENNAYCAPKAESWMLKPFDATLLYPLCLNAVPASDMSECFTIWQLAYDSIVNWFKVNRDGLAADFISAKGGFERLASVMGPMATKLSHLNPVLPVGVEPNISVDDFMRNNLKYWNK